MSNTMIKKSFFAEAAPLLLLIFIDSMGLGLVFPITNALIMDPHSHFLAASYGTHIRSLLFGTIIGIFMLCWFFGASFLGDLSDNIGRKKSLLICLIGASIGYFLSGIGVVAGSVSLLILGRIVAGFTSGSQAIAQAAVIDLSTPERKAANIGMILFAASLGFICGPLIGGVLSDSTLIPWVNFATPLYFAALLSLANAILLWCLFFETFEPKGHIKIKLHRAIEILIEGFKNEKIRELCMVLLVMIFGWSGFYSFISMFLLRQFHYPPVEIAYFMATMAIGFGAGTSFLVNICTKRFSLKNIVIVGLAFSALAVIIVALSKQIIIAWLLVVPIGATIAVAYSTILTLFSNQVDENSQGWVMGIAGAIMAFAFGINAFLLGIFAQDQAYIPILISGVGMGISAILMWYFRKKIN